ncbi:Phenolic acid decarboxylase subunit D OS=Streptomyces antimycoticus OX=68175 GN=SSPO_094110 PE=4 SV=1 [Streptomyces antimycoticus]
MRAVPDMWRTTEPARRTRRDAYPEEFMLTPEDIGTAPEVPAVPPLRLPGAGAATR